MMNVPAIVLILVLFVILMAFFSQNKIDYFPIALIIGIIAVISMFTLFNVEEVEILGFISFNTLIFIFAMQIIIYYATNDQVLEYVAIKLIHITKGDNRLLLYDLLVYRHFSCFYRGFNPRVDFNSIDLQDMPNFRDPSRDLHDGGNHYY